MIVATKSAHKKLARPLQRMSRFLPAKAMLYCFSQCKAKRVEQSKERVDSLRIFFLPCVHLQTALKNVVRDGPLNFSTLSLCF